MSSLKETLEAAEEIRGFLTRRIFDEKLNKKDGDIEFDDLKSLNDSIEEFLEINSELNIFIKSLKKQYNVK